MIQELEIGGRYCPPPELYRTPDLGDAVVCSTVDFRPDEIPEERHFLDDGLVSLEFEPLYKARLLCTTYQMECSGYFCQPCLISMGIINIEGRETAAQRLQKEGQIE